MIMLICSILDQANPTLFQASLPRKYSFHLFEKNTTLDTCQKKKKPFLWTFPEVQKLLPVTCNLWVGTLEDYAIDGRRSARV